MDGLPAIVHILGIGDLKRIPLDRSRWIFMVRDGRAVVHSIGHHLSRLLATNTISSHVY
jgi:hypothetical protein